MSIYDNETNTYPDLNTMAPQIPQTYHLKKLSKIDIEAYFLNKIEVCEQIAKKMKLFNTITMVITVGISIAAFASDVGLLVGISLSKTSIYLLKFF